MRRQYAEVASDVTPWRRNDGGKARDEGMSGEHNSVVVPSGIKLGSLEVELHFAIGQGV